MKRILALITGILSGLMMLTIFYFSSQNAEASTQVSTGLLTRIIDWIKPMADTLSGRDLDFLQIETILRKMGHFSEYTFLGLLLCLHICLLPKPRHWSLALLAGGLYAVTDELHQLFSEGRSCELRDVCIDTAGVLLGCVIVLLLRGIYHRIR